LLWIAISAVAVGALGSACDDKPEVTTQPVVVTPAEFGKAYDKLSDWHLFRDASKQDPADDVLPYQVISPLFSDYTTKFRFLYVPDGKKIGYRDDGAWDFPEGTILVKTFSYPKDVRKPFEDVRLIETRLLWREPASSCPDLASGPCWTAHTYVYSDDGKDATSLVAGKFVHVDFTGPTGEAMSNDYHVPNTVECKECHQKSDVELPLGLKTRQLDRDSEIDGETKNQIDRLFDLGYFDQEPTAAADRPRLADPTDAAIPVDDRVRSYFDSNCGHCHSDGGFASDSALWLDFDSTAPGPDHDKNVGLCKKPLSNGEGCGNEFDVVPGDPEKSIMVCRLASTEIDVKMPPLGSKIVHQEGLALVEDWISSLPADTCQ
jgi:uncharacterized repeat protein (TIGR03806 family)